MANVLGKDEYAPGTYEVVNVTIIGELGEIDVGELYEEITLTESLFNNCMRGTITLVDGVNIPSNLPISEGDVINIHLRPNQKDPWMLAADPEELHVDVEIIKISPQVKIKQDVQQYVIHFVSCSWSENYYTKVSESFYMWPYSDVAQYIFETYLCKGGLKGMMPTKGIEVTASDKEFCMIIPRWSPYKALNWLAGRSFAGPACDFLFWEDVDSFYFKPINELKAKGPVETYHVRTMNITPQGSETGPAQSEPDLVRSYFQVEDFAFKEHADVTLAAQQGMLGNILITHDIYKKRVYEFHPKGPFADNYQEDVVFDYYGDFGKTEHCEKHKELVRPDTNKKMFDDPGQPRYTLWPEHHLQWDDMDNWEPKDWLRQHKSQIHAIRYLHMECTAVGNFTRRVGDVIEIELPSPEWKKKGEKVEWKEDLRLNGNWLIVSLRRVFHRSKWHIRMELVKDDYWDFATDPIWDAAVDQDAITPEQG